MNVIIGLSAGFHDSAVSVLSFSGDILFASSEERFTRKKGDRSFPWSAIESAITFCLDRDYVIKKICLHEDPLSVIRLRDFFSKKTRLSKFLDSLNSGVLILKSLFRLKKKLSLSFNDIYIGSHHTSHAYASIATSPVNNGIVLVLDAIGERSSGLIGQFKSSGLITSRRLPIQKSLGLIYSCITVHCGFRVLTGEYKLMGLAPYGRPIYYSQLCEIFGDPTNLSYSISDIDFRSDTLISNQLTSALQFAPRIPDSGDIEQKYADLAASAQHYLESAVVSIIENLDFPTPFNLVLGGGVSLNCKLNQLLSQHPMIKSLWSFPSGGDSGSAVGVCYEYLASRGIEFSKLDNVFLGPIYDSATITRAYQSYISHPLDQRNIEKICVRLENGMVGAIYSGRSEFGPRALGNRSIIANPCRKEALAFINEKIKSREDFRPLAPIVLESCLSQYFQFEDSATELYRFMLSLAQSKSYITQVFEPTEVISARPSSDTNIPAVVHLDGSARIQVVSDDDDRPIVHLLRTFALNHNKGILVNTSFNQRGEPIVETPEDAISCFVETGLNFLVVDDRVLFRDEQPDILLMKRSLSFDPD